MSDLIVQLAPQLTRIILPMVIVVGIVGNSMNIIVLTRKTLKLHACSLYFLALSSNNLFYSSVVLIYRLLAVGYQITPINTSPTVCKIIQYINDVCPSMSPYFIVLASIDRYCASSTNAHLRKFSCVSVARWAIFSVVAIFMLFFISTAVTADVRQTDRLGCRIRTDTVYAQVYVIIQVLLLTVIAPCLMTLFGLLSMYNTRQIRVIPVAVSRYRRTEYQLARMLFFQVGTHIVLTIPLSVTYIMILLPTIFQVTQRFYAIYTICYLPFYISYAIAFIIYVLSGRVYRKELIRLIYKMLRIHRHHQVEPTNRTHNTKTATGVLQPTNTYEQQHTNEMARAYVH